MSGTEIYINLDFHAYGICAEKYKKKVKLDHKKNVWNGNINIKMS